jgi:hypothetical protein
MSQCIGCGAPLPDNGQLIEVGFNDTTTNLNLDGDPFWVEAFHHTGMTYHCVLAQATQIARATFSQVPVVTDIQVLADDDQWTPAMNDLVIIQGVEQFAVYFYFAFTAPVRGI